ncbi:hypothetical protein KUA25_06055 [Bacteroidales bacterium MSK.15.36]|nr:hypothetical protein [Bacteroidales bacterium MSK.15.36]
MYGRNTALKFDEVVTVGLTCLEQKLDTKADVKNRILEAVQNQYSIIDVKEIEELPLSIFQLLYEKLGIGFEINDGKVMGVSLESKGLILMDKGNLESLFKVAEKGIDFGSGQSITAIKISRRSY